MSGVNVGLDTNILVYAVDNRDPVLCRRAQGLVELAAGSGRCLIALQSIGEFYAAVTQRGLQPPEEAASQARDWMSLFQVVEPATKDAASALAVAAGRLSYWDCLLLATLRRAGCTTLLSEDMQDEAVVAGVTVHNPFVGEVLPEPIAVLLA